MITALTDSTARSSALEKLSILKSIGLHGRVLSFNDAPMKRFERLINEIPLVTPSLNSDDFKTLRLMAIALHHRCAIASNALQLERFARGNLKIVNPWQSIVDSIVS
jgi:hypothetical protein